VKRLVGFLKWVAFLIVILPAITSKVARGQILRPPPVLAVTEIRPGQGPLVVMEYAPFDIYEQWWKELAACEGLPLSYRRFGVQFFVLNVREYCYGGGWIIGNAELQADQIYLAFPYMMDESLVKHEMLHLLMYWNGEQTSHAPRWYGEMGVGKCGVFPHRRPVIDDR
jgi:hypothetical protein